MMHDGWREALYPLGYVAGLAFGGRFLLQWLSSEVHQRSIVTPVFWRLSLIGNLLLLIHAFIQLQFHICVIQTINAVISWRNLNLMQETSQVPLRKVLLFLAASLACLTLGFVAQGLGSHAGEIIWFRIPTPSGERAMLPVSLLWHLVGFFGLALFSCRFWVQWWLAERRHNSTLSPSFWWLSLIGGVLTLLYFLRIDDPVNAIGPALSLVPYLRNLMLLHKEMAKGEA